MNLAGSGHQLLLIDNKFRYPDGAHGIWACPGGGLVAAMTLIHGNFAARDVLLKVNAACAARCARSVQQGRLQRPRPLAALVLLRPPMDPRRGAADAAARASPAAFGIMRAPTQSVCCVATLVNVCCRSAAVVRPGLVLPHLSGCATPRRKGSVGVQCLATQPSWHTACSRAAVKVC